MVEDFGSYLKHERELRGVTLEAISETTKMLRNHGITKSYQDRFTKGKPCEYDVKSEQIIGYCSDRSIYTKYY